MLFLLKMHTHFLLEHNAILFFLRLKSLIELFVFHGLNYDLKYKLDIFIFLWYILSIFDRQFYFSQLYLFMNGIIFETLSGCDLISSKSNATIATYWKHLSSSLFGFVVAFSFFIQFEESIYEPPRLTLAVRYLNWIKNKITSFHSKFSSHFEWSDLKSSLITSVTSL